MPILPLSPIRTVGKTKRVNDQTTEVDEVTFEVHRSGSRSTIQITVERSGALSVLAPTQADDRHLIEFIEEKLLWVHTKVQVKARLQRPVPIKQFVEGEGFSISARATGCASLTSNSLICR